MNKLVFVIVLCLLHAMHSMGADQYALQWQKGNSCYEQKQYDSAAYYFEQIAAAKPKNAEVYYNLGNAYYRLNKVALAILNYQRALVINPEYTAAKDNLLLAQNRISSAIPATGDIFFINWWQSVTRADRANTLAIVSLLLFILFIALLFLNSMRKGKGKSLPPQVAGFAFFMFACFLTLAAVSARRAVAHERGVVMQPDVPLMNDEIKGKPLVLVPEGTTVKISSEKGDWIEVILPDGRRGWMQQSTLNKI